MFIGRKKYRRMEDCLVALAQSVVAVKSGIKELEAKQAALEERMDAAEGSLVEVINASDDFKAWMQEPRCDCELEKRMKDLEAEFRAFGDDLEKRSDEADREMQKALTDIFGMQIGGVNGS